MDDGAVTLFAEPEKLEHVQIDAAIEPPEAFLAAVKALKGKVRLDPETFVLIRDAVGADAVAARPGG